LPDGAVVLRSVGAELQLQGLRTALSLALGDRPAAVYLLGAGASVLSASAESEAGQCLVALKEAEIPLMCEAAEAPTVGDHQAASRIDLLDAIALAAFQQTF
jgi:hypothetical protein